MNGDEDADTELLKHFLAMVQILTFGVAFCLLTIVYYSDQPTGEFSVAEKDKTKFVTKAEVETSFALPKTLQAETQMMPFGGATIAMYAVYGRDMTDRKIWCATFIDMDEAQAWIQASKVFGRAVRGAVIADQKPIEDDADARRDAKIAQIREDLATGKLIKVDHEDGSASLYDGPNADKPN